MKSKDFLPFGAQYYRAPTPRPDQWKTDLAAIRDHGFNTIKIWAQWRWNNPSEGVFDFSDMLGLLDIAHDNGLRVVINAIYDVAPAWYWRMYPDAVMVCNDGRRVEPHANGCRQIGGTPGPSYLHQPGIKYRRAFTEAMTTTLKDHPALYIWDLWNEPELTCNFVRELKVENLVDYSPFAIAAFIEWLKAKYSAVEDLNARWNRNYQCWEEVEVPRLPDTFNDMIDWRMFFVHVLVEELRMRVEAVKKHDSATPVMVHTVPVPYFNVMTCASDEYRLAALCDLFGNSVGTHPFAAAITTAAAPGKTVLNAEIHARYGSTLNTPPACAMTDMKRHILVPLARGVKGFLFWQYRPETLGVESPAWGLTDLAGGPTPWLEHTVRLNNALQSRAGLILASRPIPADVAVVNGTANQVFDWCAGRTIDRHHKSTMGAFMALHQRGFNVDPVSTEYLLEQDISKYKVIYYPFPYYMEEAVAKRLRRYVEDGGCLIGEAFFAGVRESDGLHSQVLPGYGFDEVFGVREGLVTMGLHQFNAYAEMSGKAKANVERMPMILAQDFPGGLVAGEIVHGYRFAEGLIPRGAETLATFEDGRAAITCNRFGAGRAILIGSLPAYVYTEDNDLQTANLIEGLVRMGGAKPPAPATPDGVRVDVLPAPDGRCLVVVTNDTGGAVQAVMDLSGVCSSPRARLTNLLTGDVQEGESGAVHLPLGAGEIEVFELGG